MKSAAVSGSESEPVAAAALRLVLEPERSSIEQLEPDVLLLVRLVRFGWGTVAHQ